MAEILDVLKTAKITREAIFEAVGMAAIFVIVVFCAYEFLISKL